MGTVVLNNPNNATRDLSLAPEADRNDSSVTLGGGFLFYSNNPESVNTAALAENGRYLNRATVTGSGQVYTWHVNKTGRAISNSLHIINENNFPIRISVNTRALTNHALRSDNDAWITFWGGSGATTITIQAGGSSSLFIQNNISNDNVFGIIGRINITHTSVSPAPETLHDVAYIANPSGAGEFAEIQGSGSDPGSKRRGFANSGFWQTMNFHTLSPNDLNGSFYTISKYDATFSGEDLVQINDPSGATSGGLAGSYGCQININLKIHNTDPIARNFRIYLASRGGLCFPCFHYNNGRFRFGARGTWGHIPAFQAIDIIEVNINRNVTMTVPFQIVVPAVASTPYVIGARLI